MKKYILGARNNKRHNFSVILNTNSKLLAYLFYYLCRWLFNETEVIESDKVTYIENEPPFDDKYVHQNE